MTKRMIDSTNKNVRAVNYAFSKLNNWFKNTDKPGKLDWVIVIFLGLFCLLFYIYPDFLSTTDQGIMLIEATTKGRFLDFYQYCIENKQTAWAPTYELPIFILFAVWNLPIYLLNLVVPFNYISNPISMLYSKSFMVIMTIGCGILIYKIVILMGLSIKKARWATFLFFSSGIVLFSSILISQVDIASVFFALLGIRSYLKKDTKGFCLWFSVSVTMKLFSLLIFIPLVLLIEKKVWKIVGYSLSGTSLLLVSKALFIGNEGYKICMSKFSGDTFNRIIGINLRTGLKEVSIFLALYTIFCIICYIKSCKTKKEFYMYAAYIPLVVFSLLFMFVMYPYPYWCIIIAPYIILVMVQNPAVIKVNLLIDAVGWFSFYISSIDIYSWVYSAGVFNEKLIPGFLRADSETRQFHNMFDIINNYGMGKLLPIFYALFIASSVVFLIINFPRKNLLSKDDELCIERGVVWLRTLLIIPIMASIIFCYFSIKPLVVLNTTNVNYISSNVRVIDPNTIIRQPLKFNHSYNLDDISILFFCKEFNIIDYASISVELKDYESDKVLFKCKEPINMIHNEQLYTINLKSVKVQSGKEYVLILSGNNDGGHIIEPAITKQLMTEEPLIINGKETGNSLYMKLTAKPEKNIESTKYIQAANGNSQLSSVLLEGMPEVGKILTASVTVKNTGKTPWNEESNIHLFVWDNDVESERGYVAQGDSVQPGEEYTFKVNLTPTVSGSHKYSFMMVQEGITWFGEKKEITVKVP